MHPAALGPRLPKRLVGGRMLGTGSRVTTMKPATARYTPMRAPLETALKSALGLTTGWLVLLARAQISRSIVLIVLGFVLP
eukprot:2456189-Pyramimonas_sp.AAC.1